MPKFIQLYFTLKSKNSATEQDTCHCIMKGEINIKINNLGICITSAQKTDPQTTNNCPNA